VRIIKRNQLIIAVLALMLITAGYLNSTSRNNENMQTSGIIEEMALAELGDATLVSSNAVQEETINEELNADEQEKNLTEVVNNSTGDYYATSRLEREKMYSQMLESYQKMLDSSQISETQKGIAQTEIDKINKTKNAIMIVENLLKAKGIDDIILLVNDISINVVVKTEKLSQDKVAQIQNIVSREMNAEIDNIHISEHK